MERQTVTVEEAADMIGIGRNTAYDAIRRGTFPAPVVRVGRRYVVPLAPLQRLLQMGRAEE